MSLPDLYRHQEWADATVWRAVVALGSDDQRVRDLLYHIHLVQHAYIGMWRGDAPSFREASSFADLGAILRWGRDAHAKMAPLVESLSPEAAKTIAIPWTEIVEKQFGRKVGPVTAGETLMQVVMHSQYHRGQVNARIRELGAVPPMVDYIAWVWLERPAPEWPDSTAA